MRIISGLCANRRSGITWRLSRRLFVAYALAVVFPPPLTPCDETPTDDGPQPLDGLCARALKARAAARDVELPRGPLERAEVGSTVEMTWHVRMPPRTAFSESPPNRPRRAHRAAARARGDERRIVHRVLRGARCEVLAPSLVSTPSMLRALKLSSRAAAGRGRPISYVEVATAARTTCGTPPKSPPRDPPAIRGTTGADEDMFRLRARAAGAALASRRISSRLGAVRGGVVALVSRLVWRVAYLVCRGARAGAARTSARGTCSACCHAATTDSISRCAA